MRTSSFRTSQKNPDEVIITRCEQAIQVRAGVNRVSFSPGSSGLPLLDGLATYFDNYHLNSAVVEYIPNTSAFVSGKVVLGIDYNSDSPITDEGSIANLTGAKSTNIYQKIAVPVVASRANKSRWSSTAASTSGYNRIAFTAAVWADEAPDITSSGTIWVRYSVTLAGVNAAHIAAMAAAKTSTLVNRTIPATPVANVTDEPTTSNSIQPSEATFKTALIVDPAEPTQIGTQTNELPMSKFSKPGDQITLALATATAPDTVTLATLQDSAAQVNFYYADGSPVEANAIRSFSVGKNAKFRAGVGVVPHNATGKLADENNVTGIVADLFQIVTPLLKHIPIVGEIVNVLSPSLTVTDNSDMHEYDVGEDHSIVRLSAEAYNDAVPFVSAVALGDEISAQLPTTATFNSVEYLTSTYSYVIYRQNTTFFTYEIQSSPFTFEVTKVTVSLPNFNDVQIPTLITVSAPEGVDSIRAGDVFSFNSYVITIPEAGSTAIEYATSSSDILNLNFVDSQGIEAVPYARNVAVMRDNEAVSIRLPALTPEQILAATTSFGFSFTRISRANTDTVVHPEPPAAVARSLVLHN